VETTCLSAAGIEDNYQVSAVQVRQLVSHEHHCLVAADEHVQYAALEKVSRYLHSQQRRMEAYRALRMQSALQGPCLCRHNLSGHKWRIRHTT
jgi:hypothetical protein